MSVFDPSTDSRQIGNNVRFKFLMGSEVENIVDGFTGIITSRCQVLNGCLQYCVKPAMRKGEPQEAKWFDEEELTVVSEKGVREKLYGKPLKQGTAGPLTANQSSPSRTSGNR